MTTQEAYELVCDRLTIEQRIQLTVKEHNINRPLSPYEIVTIFKLTPYVEIRQPRKRRMSDEVENDSHWSDL
jgi:hypothetical protein